MTETIAIGWKSAGEIRLASLPTACGGNRRRGASWELGKGPERPTYRIAAVTNPDLRMGCRPATFGLEARDLGHSSPIASSSLTTPRGSPWGDGIPSHTRRLGAVWLLEACEEALS
jgi:hypothetical protein